jgi:hypothetical protein
MRTVKFKGAAKSSVASAAFGRDDDTINSLRFQSINSLGLPWSSPFNTHAEAVVRLHVPMWRWEVEKEWLGTCKVTFL